MRLPRFYVRIHFRRLLLTPSPYTVELKHKHNIDILINHQDIRQYHFPGDQNRAEDRYEEKVHNPNEDRGRRSTCISTTQSGLSD